MQIISIDTVTGTLKLNNIVIAPVPLAILRERLAAASITVEELNPNQDFVTLGIQGSLDTELFGVNLTYFKNQLEAVWLGWDGGVTKMKGYNTTTKELIGDKEKLARFLSRILQKEPEERTETYSTFIFKWGQISAAASLRAVTVSIGIVWN